MPELPDPTTINVANLTQLNAAILQVDQATTPSAYTIQFTATISDGGTDVTALNLASGVSVTIDGGSYALDGSENTGSGLFVYAGNVTLQNLTIRNAGARGGSGGFGGGGAGLGGGLFVASAGTVTLNNVTFNDDAAQGGNGGQGSFNYSAESSAVTTATTNVEATTGQYSTGGGGGGGLGGAGGSMGPVETYGDSWGGGGGGVGRGAVGGGYRYNNGAGAGIIPGAAGGGRGTEDSGGASAGGGGPGISNGAGGGGGVGGSDASDVGDGQGEIYGGAGGFGGGGGGSQLGRGSGGGGGLDVVAQNSLTQTNDETTGGGGGTTGGPGTNTTGGGGGGGGLGAGGDIFIQQGGSVIIEGGSLSGGQVYGGQGGSSGGAGGNPGQSGQAFGSGIFLQGNETLYLAPGLGQTLTISDQIADQDGSSSGSGGSGGQGGLDVYGQGTTVLDDTNTYTGGTTIGGGTLVLGAPGAAGSGDIAFQANIDPTLAFTLANAPTNQIDGFTFGDTIDITDITTTATTASLGPDNVLSIPYTSGGGGILTLQLDPNAVYTNDEVFYLIPDGSTGTDVVLGAPCYCRGTLIQTPTGEVPIEQLAIGDAVLTAAGMPRPITWIGRRSYGIDVAAHPTIRPVRIRAGALDDGIPRRDLYVSPNHALFIDGALILAGALINGRSITPAPAEQPVEYFHIELDSHDVILAEGAPAESYLDDGSRAQFHNAADHTTLYPAATPQQPVTPRLLEGAAVDAAADRLALRALTLTPPTGPLIGHLDESGPTRIRGWAWNPGRPDDHIIIEILAGTEIVARTEANLRRRDLRECGLGTGRHGFEVVLPAGAAGHPLVARAA